jgi:hypothetical protein
MMIFQMNIASETLLSEVRMGKEIYYRYTYTEADLILGRKKQISLLKIPVQQQKPTYSVGSLLG